MPGDFEFEVSLRDIEPRNVLLQFRRARPPDPPQRRRRLAPEPRTAAQVPHGRDVPKDRQPRPRPRHPPGGSRAGRLRTPSGGMKTRLAHSRRGCRALRDRLALGLAGLCSSVADRFTEPHEQPPTPTSLAPVAARNGLRARDRAEAGPQHEPLAQQLFVLGRRRRDLVTMRVPGARLPVPSSKIFQASKPLSSVTAKPVVSLSLSRLGAEVLLLVVRLGAAFEAASDQKAGQDDADAPGGVLNYRTHGITNGVAERLNSKIITIKRLAGGLRNRANFKTAVYSHCGGLDLCPR